EGGRQGAIDAIRPTIKIESVGALIRGPEVLHITHGHRVGYKHRRKRREVPPKRGHPHSLKRRCPRESFVNTLCRGRLRPSPGNGVTSLRAPGRNQAGGE